MWPFGRKKTKPYISLETTCLHEAMAAAEAYNDLTGRPVMIGIGHIHGTTNTHAQGCVVMKAKRPRPIVRYWLHMEIWRTGRGLVYSQEKHDRQFVPTLFLSPETVGRQMREGYFRENRNKR